MVLVRHENGRAVALVRDVHHALFGELPAIKIERNEQPCEGGLLCISALRFTWSVRAVMCACLWCLRNACVYICKPLCLRMGACVRAEGRVVLIYILFALACSLRAGLGLWVTEWR